jgi:hypothetical protein
MVAARTGQSLSAFMRYSGNKVAEEIIEAGGGLEALEKWYADIQALGAQYK